MQVTKQNVISFIRELVIVIIGILIALSINTWNANRKDEIFIEKALFAIEEEISLNQTDIRSIVQKHENTLDTIAIYVDDDHMSLEQIIKRVSGFQVAELKNIGLRFFISDKAELIDYETISMLSEIEFHSETVKTKTQNLVNHLYNKLDSTNKSDKHKFAIYLSDIMNSELKLLKLYDAFLNERTNASPD
ncbi:MAG: hypothetical protein AAF587_27405 [Bacteroidota bacterium]